MEIPRHLNEDDVSEENIVRRPSEIIMACRGGAVVDCPSIEAATDAASKLAGRRPGVVVGVYQLIGFAFTPERPADFIPIDQLRISSEKSSNPTKEAESA